MPRIKLYDIHGLSAIQNFPRLLTGDHECFYWDNKAFAQYQIGDKVFWVCRAHKLALYTEIENTSIEPAYENGLNLLNDNGYGLSAIASSAQDYQTFIRFRVLDEVAIPEGWNYAEPKTFGSMNMQLGLLEGRNTNIDKRLDKINDLQQLFSGHEVAQTALDEAINILTNNGATLFHGQEPRVWFVTQGNTFREGLGKDFLWAPNKDKNGFSKFYWSNMLEVSPGDIIFNYSSGAIKGVSIARSTATPADNPETTSPWSKEGHRIDIDLTEFKQPIKIHQLIQRKSAMDHALAEVTNKPFAVTGQVNQGYLYQFTPQGGRLIREIYGEPFGQPDIDAFFDRIANPAPAPIPTNMTAKEALQSAYAYLQSQGYQYTFEEVANFYAALRTKPFVILAGISGTGKTQLPRQLAAGLGFDKSQVIQVPVRPDWTDSTELLGYTALDGNFVPKALTLAIQQAASNPTLPYFFILDEMNLARVEHYFSDFLSVIETRSWAGDKVSTDPILRPDALKGARNAGDFGALSWPPNLYLIGTVNMDETTHAFSRKVLDRANTLEMNQVDLNWPAARQNAAPLARSISNDYFETRYLQASDLTTEDQSYLKPQLDLLIAINKILQQADLHFAYRLRDEFLFYMLICQQLDLLSDREAEDFQLVQKILPRIHGSSERIQRVLVELLNLLEGKTFDARNFDFLMLEGAIDPAALQYPRASSKIIFMLQRYHEDRFTSFWL